MLNVILIILNIAFGIVVYLFIGLFALNIAKSINKKIEEKDSIEIIFMFIWPIVLIAMIIGAIVKLIRCLRNSKKFIIEVIEILKDFGR